MLGARAYKAQLPRKRQAANKKKKAAGKEMPSGKVGGGGGMNLEISEISLDHAQSSQT